MFKLIALAFVLFIIIAIIAFLLSSVVFVAIGNSVVKLMNKTMRNIFGEEKE